MLSYYAWLRLSLFIAGKKFSVIGLENIPKNKTYVVAANHINSSDSYLISGVFYRHTMIRWVVKSEIKNYWKYFQHDRKRGGHSILKTLFLTAVMVTAGKNCDTISVKRDEKSAQNTLALFQMKSVLEKGRVVGIFPESRRTKKRIVANPSFLTIAKLVNVQVVPCYVSRNKVIIGKPFSVKKNLTRAGCAALVEDMMDSIYALNKNESSEKAPFSSSNTT